MAKKGLCQLVAPGSPACRDTAPPDFGNA